MSTQPFAASIAPTGLANDGGPDDPTVQLIDTAGVMARTAAFVSSEIASENAANLAKFQAAARSWLSDAQWHQDNNLPFTLPKPEAALAYHLILTRDPKTNAITSISSSQGPDQVAPPLPDLPAKAAIGPKNVVIGAQLSGSVFGVGKGDTCPDGFRVTVRSGVANKPDGSAQVVLPTIPDGVFTKDAHFIFAPTAQDPTIEGWWMKTA